MAQLFTHPIECTTTIAAINDVGSTVEAPSAEVNRLSPKMTVQWRTDKFWKKYGQTDREVGGVLIQKHYFKCKVVGCPVKRKVEVVRGVAAESCKYVHNHSVDERGGHSPVAPNPDLWQRSGIEDFAEVASTDEADGYSWIKYGQKRLSQKGILRCYYRCQVQACAMQKQLDYPLQSLGARGTGPRVRHLTVGHNHPKPHLQATGEVQLSSPRLPVGHKRATQVNITSSSLANRTPALGGAAFHTSALVLGDTVESLPQRVAACTGTCGAVMPPEVPRIRTRRPSYRKRTRSGRSLDGHYCYESTDKASSSPQTAGETVTPREVLPEGIRELREEDEQSNMAHADLLKVMDELDVCVRLLNQPGRQHQEPSSPPAGTAENGRRDAKWRTQLQRCVSMSGAASTADVPLE